MSLMFKVVVACVVATLVWVFALTRHPRVAAQVVAVTSVERPSVLTHLDRCEVKGCRAQAYFRGLFEPLSDTQKRSALDFCRHHFLEQEAAVRAVAYHVIDESWKLSETDLVS
jgi:hypothetical protein